VRAEPGPESHDFLTGFPSSVPLLPFLRRELSVQNRGWQAALQAARNPAVRTVSLDVFDTVLLRRVRAETHRFRELANHLHAALRRAGGPAPDPLAIWHARCRAARLAYRTTPLTDGCREATHRAILDIQLADLHLDCDLADLFHRTEIAWEISQLRLSEAAVALASEARSLGKRVVACSDMYLAAEDVRTMIETLGGAEMFDSIYISSETRRGKSNGAMFHHMIRVGGVPADAILHVGDNFSADCLGARRAGVRAVWVPRTHAFRITRFADEMLASRSSATMGSVA